jgi:hypothetical protein
VFRRGRSARRLTPARLRRRARIEKAEERSKRMRTQTWMQKVEDAYQSDTLVLEFELVVGSNNIPQSWSVTVGSIRYPTPAQKITNIGPMEPASLKVSFPGGLAVYGNVELRSIDIHWIAWTTPFKVTP